MDYAFCFLWSIDFEDVPLYFWFYFWSQSQPELSKDPVQLVTVAMVMAFRGGGGIRESKYFI